VPQFDIETIADPSADAAIDRMIQVGEPTQVTQLPFELRARYTGRSSAVERLLASIERTRNERTLSFAALVGEPGMGKSATLEELARQAAAKWPDTRFWVGAADGSGVLYAPFGRLLGARFGLVAGEALDDTHDRIIAGVGEVMPAARVIETAHLIAHLMRIPFPDSPIIAPLAEAPQQLEARTFLALRRFLAADAERAPMVLCLENLELAEPESINLLHYLAAGLTQSRVVLLGTARATVYDRHPSFGSVDVALEQIELGPLDQGEIDELLAELCSPLGQVPSETSCEAIERDPCGVPPRLAVRAKKLGGSPRALFELLRYLLESEVIVRAGGGSWRLDEEALAGAALPDSHEHLVAARVRVMPEADRRVLEMASVIGETLWMDGVVALVRVGDLYHVPASAPAGPAQPRASTGSPAPRDPDGPTLAQIAAAGDQTRSTTAAAIARLVEREWLVPAEASSIAGEREYRFAYPYLWSTVYGGIPPERRHAYHRVVAQYLELRPEGRAAMAQEDVARHLELAGDQSGAAARYRRAADFARKNFFNQRAIRLYSQALACLGEADLAARIHLWHDLGSVYELKGDYEAALGGFERMLRLAWVCASRTKAAVAFNKMGRVWRRKGDLTLALEYLERGLELFVQADDHRGIAGSLDDVGTVLYLLGRYDEAYEKVTQGLARRGRGGDPRSIAHSLANLGNIQKDRGRFTEALNCHREALELRREIGDRVGVIGSLNNLAVLAFEHGDYAGARQGWEQALGQSEEIGALPLQALSLCNLGELALGEDRAEEARRRLEEALEIAVEVDDRRLQVEATRNLALLEHAAGDGPRAQQLAQRAYQVAASAGLRDNEGRALLTLGQVFSSTALMDDDPTIDRARPSEPSIADGYFARGIELLRQIGNESELARGLDRYGRHKIERGETGEGIPLLEEALQLFRKLGMREHADVEKVLTAL
jgi:tetratricopeptide (TPR) repeat protein